MAVNKVIVGDETVLDLSSDTVTPETMTKGTTAHDKAGKPIVGTASAVQTYIGTFTSDSNGYAEVDIGFCPDVLTIFFDSTYISDLGGNVDNNVCFDFANCNDGEWLEIMAIRTEDDGVNDFASRTIENGFAIHTTRFSWSWNRYGIANTAFSFSAAKYT